MDTFIVEDAATRMTLVLVCESDGEVHFSDHLRHSMYYFFRAVSHFGSWKRG